MALANLWLISLQGKFLIVMAMSCLDLYPLIRPPRRQLLLDRERILNLGFIRSFHMLIVYVLYLSIGKDFPLVSVRTEGISQSSPGLLECQS